MQKLWKFMKVSGYLLGPMLLLLAGYFWLVPPAPFSDLTLPLAIVSAIISAIAWLFARGPERKQHRSMLAIVALVALSFWLLRTWDGTRGYSQQDLIFENRGARLAGTLYLPDRTDRVPGIVWVHGSGPQTRGINKSQVTHFVRSGYAVLIFDKRGVGESTGHFEFENAVDPNNIDLLASDVSVALSLLASRPEVLADKVGLIGVSQAGWVIPRAAVMNGHAAFMLLLSGPATSTHTQMRYERYHLGEPSGEFSISTTFKAFGRGDIPDGMTPDQADVEAQKLTLDLPYADYDPTTDLRALNIPGLWLLGDSDWMVPSGSTAQKIEELRQQGKPYQYRNIPGAIHGMMLGPRMLVLDTIDSWLAEVAAERR